MDMNQPVKPTVIPFKIASVPMGNGATWFKNAVILLKSQPWIVLITVAWTLLISMLINSVPYVGLSLSTVVAPVFAFGMADVAQKIRLQQSISPLDVFSGFHPNHRTRLFTLGAILAIIPTLLIIYSMRLDMGPLDQFIKSAQAIYSTNATATSIEALQKQQEALLAQLNNPALLKLLLPTLSLMAYYLLVSVLFAFSPLFIVWQNASPVRSLSLSLVAVLKNILPFIVVFLMLFGVYLAMGLLMLIIMSLAPALSMYLALPLVFIFVGFLHMLTFTSYHNIVITSLRKSVSNSLSDVV